MLKRPKAEPLGALPHSNGSCFTGFVPRGPNSMLAETITPTMIAEKTQRMATETNGLMGKLGGYRTKKWHVKGGSAKAPRALRTERDRFQRKRSLLRGYGQS